MTSHQKIIAINDNKRTTKIQKRSIFLFAVAVATKGNIISGSYSIQSSTTTMVVSTERFAVFFVVLLGTVWSSQGARTFGTDVLLRPRTFANRKSVSRSGSLSKIRSEVNHPSGILDRHSSLRSMADLFQLRGGEISLPDDDEDESSGVILTKLRNVIRGILNISDNKLPLVSGLLRTCFKTIETITGLIILPQKKSSKKKKNKTNNKSKKKISEDGEVEEKEKAKSKPKKKPTASAKKTSIATKKHLSTSIKSTNPNYRIQKELKSFIKSPPPNLTVQVGSNIRIWVVTILGAKDTIYEGEIFKLRISFPPQYPTVPPSVYFLKKNMPIHEHVYTNGDICLSLLGNGWRPTMSAQSIAVSILSILSSAQSKSLPMDNASHATAKPGKYQKDWVYHDDRC